MIASDLYQELLLDHSKYPRNKHDCQNCEYCARGHNPLCGDDIHIMLNLTSENIISEISFLGEGCALCMACASLLTEKARGVSRDKMLELFEVFHDFILGRPVDETLLEKFIVFKGVSHYPMRVKCASLPWHTLKSALLEKIPTTTE